MLKDETLSYLIVKRDAVRIGAKFILVGGPLLFTLTFKGDLVNQEGLLAAKLPQDSQLNVAILDMYDSVDDQKLFLSILNGEHHGIDHYLKTNKSLPVEKEVLGNYLPHIAVKEIPCSS